MLNKNSFWERVSGEFKNDSPFTKEGFAAFKEEVAEYIDRLSRDSDTIRKANRSDRISAAHVRDSGTRLLNKNLSQRINIMNTLGGILLGVSISNLLLVLGGSGTLTSKFFLVSSMCGILGGLFLGYGFLKAK